MTSWNHDMDAAPRGVVHVESRKFGDATREFRRVEIEWLWLALPDGKVFRCHWVEPTTQHPKGRWAGLHHETIPVAWMRYEAPAHPDICGAAETFGKRDADRALILIRTSNNAHDFINFSIITERVERLVPAARAELAETLIRLGEQFRDASAS